MKRGWLILAVAGLTGCAGPVHTLRFHEEVPASLPESRARRVTLPYTDLEITVNPYPTISERDVHEARLQPTAGGDAVQLQFDSHGLVKLSEMTTRLRGQYVVVFVDDKPVAATLVERPIADGRFLLFGELTDDEAKELVQALNKLAGRARDLGDPRMAPTTP